MAVRVAVRIEFLKKKINAVALVNTGYETNKPELLLPVRFARMFRVWPNLPPETRGETYATAGARIRVYRLKKQAQISLTRPLTRPVNCDLIIGEQEEEILLSDALISALGIVIEDAKKGIWRLKGGE